MSRINYVMASFNQNVKRKAKYPEPCDTLTCQLTALNSLSHNLDQITLMKARSTNQYKEYYAAVSNNVVQVECENYGYSMGQWLLAYETYGDEFDYYLFNEDDYCFLQPNFDETLLRKYKETFPQDIGLLCSLVEGNETSHPYPIHHEGLVFISSKTLKQLYEFPLFKGDPRGFMDTMSWDVDPRFRWANKEHYGYIGGYFQLAFSHMFTLAGIGHKSYIESIFPYWCDTNGIRIYRKDDTLKQIQVEDFKNNVYGPVQISQPSFISAHTGLPNITFIMGMHRCGTSFLTSCMANQGYSIGKSRNKDKDWQNPLGYFENDKFTEFHNELLRFNDCSWNTIKRGEYNWTRGHVRRYRQLIADEFGSDKNIMIKDPRLTFFEDFLVEVCKERYITRFLFCTRNREECCNSLANAQNIPHAQAEAVYDISHNFINDTMEKIDYEDVRNNNIPWLNSSTLFEPKLYRNHAC